MTIPYERLRALVAAKTFLEDTANRASHAERFKGSLPESIVNTARDAAQHMPTARALVATSRRGISVVDYFLELADKHSIGSVDGAPLCVIDALKRGLAPLEQWHLSPSSLRSLGQVIPVRHVEKLNSIMRHCPTTKELGLELGYHKPIQDWIAAGPTYGVKPDWLIDAERSL
jgi:hypothetical protein